MERGLENIRWSTRKLVEKGKVQGSVDEIMGRIEAVTDLAAARDVDFVFEAITEDLDAKRRIFAELDEICPARAILATNTSAIPITNIAAATQRAPKVVGTHFFSPVPIMRVVEIVAGLLTSDDTMDECRESGKKPGKGDDSGKS